MFKEIVGFIRELYNQPEGIVPLHAPTFIGNEKKYLNECIDSTFVSYVGKFVTQFEALTAQFTGSKYAIAVSNGTSALQIALLSVGVKNGDEVITQPLTFVATTNAISHCGASPVFVDVEKSTLGMSPDKLEEFLSKSTLIKSDGCYNKITNNKISACVPVHIFGHPCKIDKIVEICRKYHITVVEDSAESLGSYYKGKHTGTFGRLGILSYNGNKTITTGGGGMILTNEKELAEFAKHITTTAKVTHPWEFIHDEVAFNYRMPNVNAAIGVAQMESLDPFLESKRETAIIYKDFFNQNEIQYISEPQNAKSNYWLNAIILKNRSERDHFLEYTNKNGIITRPIWRLMNKLDMYKGCQSDDLSNSEWLEERVVNIPSSFRYK
jgi:aminotransferase in exopolysaccharide biosynthesis